MADVIKDFLTSIGMQHHFSVFQMRGYDDESDIPNLEMSDLQTIGITDPMEIIIILKAAHSHKESPEYKLLCWLREHGLAHYFEGFIHSGLILLSDVAQLELPDETIFDELEITLPGHQRRLERAVSSLRKKQRQDGFISEDSRLETEGWWGYPSYLPNAKYPFLCVQATIQSTRPLGSSKTIDFMVDSGSDVSTLREDIVQDLNLEPITTVRSCGAHGSVRTTMYRAYVYIGDSKLEIEVIGSSYDSIGSRVLRHFNHHINSSRHKWFRASQPSTAHQDSSQASLHSREGLDREAETVSVLPEPDRRALYTNTTQGRDSESSASSGGSGASSAAGKGGESDHGAGGTAGEKPSGSSLRESGVGDETDSSRAPSQDSRVLFVHSDEGLNNSYSYHSHPSSSSSHNGPALMSSSDCASPRKREREASRMTPTKQGHLMISGDGTISFLLDSDRTGKRHKTTADGT